jgi:hypothetical protein
MANTIELVTKLRDQLTGPLRTQSAALSGWQGKALAAGIAATGAAIAVARLTQQFIRFADQLTAPLARIQDTAEGLRISASELAGLQFVIEQAGGSAEGLDPIFARMRASISGAADAGSTAARALDELNLSQAQLAQMNASDQFITITGALSQYAGTADQARLAQELLGRGAVNLRGALNLSEAQIRTSIDAARDMGVVMGDDAYAAADQFQDMLKAAKDRFVSLQMEGLQPILPAIAEFLESGLDLAQRVLPSIINQAGKLFGALSDVAEIFQTLADIDDVVAPWNGPIMELNSQLSLFEQSLGVVGFAVHGVASLIRDTGESTIDATPGLQVYTAAMNALRDAANQAEAELEAVASQLDAVESARQYKKDEGYQDIVSAREPSGGGGGVPGGPTEDDFKNSKDAYIEYLSAVEEMQMAAADRVAQHQMEAAERAKQATIDSIEAQAAAEEAAVQRRIAATEQAMRSGEEMGRVIGGVLAQGAQDQITFAEGMDAVGASMIQMIAESAAQAVMAYAAEAAAAAAASQAGIPVIGPFLAAAAMGSMLALVQGLLGGIPHAASGWIVPGSHRGDRVPAILEPGERVLTRAEARDYAGGSARGSTVVNLSLGSMFSSASRADLQKAGRVLREVMAAEGI